MTADAPDGRTAADGSDPSGDGDATARRDHDRRRIRTTFRVLGIGVVMAVLAALGAGILGVPGGIAGALFLSLLSLAVGVSGAVVAVGALVDQFRGQRVSLRRLLLTGALVMLTLALLVASAGAFVGAAERLT